MSKSPSKRAKNGTDDWTHLITVGGLLGAIALVLVLGALLRADPAGTADDLFRPTAIPLDTAPEPPRRPPPRTDRDPLASRVVEDLDRLGDTGWTRQLAAVCDPDNVRRWIETHGDQSDLYVLPVTIADRSCFRVCWGRWSSSAAAERARLPSAVAVRAGNDGQVRSVVEIVR